MVRLVRRTWELNVNETKSKYRKGSHTATSHTNYVSRLAANSVYPYLPSERFGLSAVPIISYIMQLAWLSE
jgi:hypothetical protein